RGDVDDPADQVARLGLEAQSLGRVQRGELAELHAVLGRLGVGAVHRVDPHHRVELLPALAVTRLADLADDGITATEAVLANHRQRHVDVVGAGQVAARADERVVVQHVEDAGGGSQYVVVEDRGVRLAALRAGLRAVGTVAAAATTATSAATLVVGAVLLGLLVGLPVLLAALPVVVLRLAVVAVAVAAVAVLLGPFLPGVVLLGLSLTGLVLLGLVLLGLVLLGLVLLRLALTGLPAG